MATFQLRTYRMSPGKTDAWVKWLCEVAIPVREKHGFRVNFVLVTEALDQVVWSVSHPCEFDEFDEIEAKYMASPDHAELSAALPGFVTSTDTTKVRAVVPPTGP
jgi:antibiotic biosynthesis monooxygenase (ABM) superfamily enzyme